MRELEPPDTHHVNAAMGWFELGNVEDAREELRRVSDANREHPAVLEVLWRIEAAGKAWAPALEVAHRMLSVAPEDPAGWINQAYSLHELKRTEEALECLLKAVRRFPDVPTIPYNLACYACQLGQPALTWEWLEQAAKLLGKETVKRMARTDPDLASMREAIERM